MGQESEDMTMVLVKKRGNAGRFNLIMMAIILKCRSKKIVSPERKL